MSAMLSSNATFSMEMFPFRYCPKGNGDVSLVYSVRENNNNNNNNNKTNDDRDDDLENIKTDDEQSHDEAYSYLKGGSGNSRGKRLAISMVIEAWLSEKEECWELRFKTVGINRLYDDLGVTSAKVYVTAAKVCPIVNALAGGRLGAYDLRVATPRASVHAGDKTSGDARISLKSVLEVDDLHDTIPLTHFRTSLFCILCYD
ncbi:hypothetical protein Tco_0974959 [Tanacetum coccineum]|uniref:Uncharacterized protein n=1 Tax=Tanacetum coccineum TaxID=301880 RepID=A0ABQ5ED85_9ASTR